MSKYLTYTDVLFKDRATLLAALGDLGHTQIEEGEALALYGYHGDQRRETAEIVVRRRHIGAYSNDIGFAKTAEGYIPIVSDYDGRTLRYRHPDGYTQRFVPALRTRYNERVAVALAGRLRGSLVRQPQGQTIKMAVRF